MLDSICFETNGIHLKTVDWTNLNLVNIAKFVNPIFCPKNLDMKATEFETTHFKGFTLDLPPKPHQVKLLHV